MQYKDPLPLKRLPTPADLRRFLKFVKLGPRPPADTKLTDRCWLFESSPDNKNYRQFWFGGRSERAHRFSFQGFRRKKAKKGMHIHHKCRNTACCNPGHLTQKTVNWNVADGNRNRSRKIKEDVPI